jgi:hypothetical protein
MTGYRLKFRGEKWIEVDRLSYRALTRLLQTKGANLRTYQMIRRKRTR